MDQVYKQKLAACAASSTPALRSAIAGERVAALDAARANLKQARDIEAERLAAETRNAMAEHARAVGLLESQAEATRRERSDAILKKVFAQDALPSLIATWRQEPGRQATVAIQKLWTQLNAIVLAELGDPEGVGLHLLTACLLDAIADEIPASALVRTCSADTGSVVEAAGAWRRAVDPPDPGAGSAALEALERELFRIARWESSEALGPQHRERAQLRKQHVTRRDFSAAANVFEENEKRRVQAAFEANYVAPAPPRLHRGAINDGFVSALDPDTTRGAPHAAADGGGLLNRARGWIAG